MSGDAVVRAARSGEPMEDAVLLHTFFRRAATEPDRIAFEAYAPHSTAPYARTTWGEWALSSEAIGAWLLDRGIEPGARVVILASNRPLWPITDIGVQMIGGVSVGVYPSSAEAQVAALLTTMSPAVVVVDTLARLDLVRRLRDTLGASFPIVCDDLVVDAGQEIPGVFDVAGVLAHGGRLCRSLAVRERLHAVRMSIAPSDTALLIHTSGSTGEAKAACLSHRYLAASAASIAAVLGLTADDRAVSFLAFSHAAERVFGLFTRIHTGMAAALVEDPTDVFTVAAQYEPTVFGGLPRLYERLYEAAEAARANGADMAEAVFSRVGRRCRVATSGGASLPAHVAESLATLGLPVLGAYGQTEHLCIAMNRPGHARADTVGPPMPGTAVRIADDGELLVRRSALTFSGYYGRPEATQAAFTEDGTWLRTGDRAEVLDDGALRITGRIKELIALSTGRKIAPAPIESALAATPLIAHAFCFGEGHKYLTAIIALRHAAVERWADARHITTDWPELADDPALHIEILGEIERVNATLARTDRIQRFLITADRFSIEAGELTPTLKPVRHVIAARYFHDLAQLYE